MLYINISRNAEIHADRIEAEIGLSEDGLDISARWVNNAGRCIRVDQVKVPWAAFGNAVDKVKLVKKLKRELMAIVGVEEDTSKEIPTGSAFITEAVPDATKTEPIVLTPMEDLPTVPVEEPAVTEEPAAGN